MAVEKQLQTKILNDLRYFGKYCETFKIISSSDNGEPDLFFTTKLTGGVFIETKKQLKSPEKIQKYKIDKLNQCGCKAFSCSSWQQWMHIKNELKLTLVNIKSYYD